MKFNRFIVLLVCGIVTLTSCKKQLDSQPNATLSDENAFTTLDHIQLGVNGAFGRTSAYANNMYVSALLSDEARIGAGNAGQGTLTYRYQFNSDQTTGGDVTSAYYSYYQLIDQVNRVLPNVDKVAIVAGQETRRSVLKGQLLALRAMGHLELLRLYADRYDPAKPGVPIMTSSCVTCKPARNTMGEVMAQVEKDFTDAKALMPATTSGNFTDTVFNQLNITAYQARAALFKGDFANAIAHASTVISSGIKPLVGGTSFRNIWTDDNTNEILFRRRYENSTTIGSLWTTTAGTIYFAPSDKLTAAYSAADVRSTAYIGTDAASNRYVNKFFTSSRGGRAVDMKIIRMSEMYLIRAEAYARQSSPNLAAGSADLNTLRSFRISGYTPVTYATAATLLDAVLEERFKELAFEGHRWFDLKRNNRPVERAATDANPAWQNLPADSYRWILPIPRDEIIANPNTVQNPGYSV